MHSMGRAQCPFGHFRVISLVSVLTFTLPVSVTFTPSAVAKIAGTSGLICDTWLANSAARSAAVCSGGGGGLNMALGKEVLETPTVSELVVSSILLLGGGGGAGGGGGTSMVTVRMRP